MVAFMIKNKYAIILISSLALSCSANAPQEGADLFSFVQNKWWSLETSNIFFGKQTCFIIKPAPLTITISKADGKQDELELEYNDSLKTFRVIKKGNLFLSFEGREPEPTVHITYGIIDSSSKILPCEDADSDL